MEIPFFCPQPQEVTPIMEPLQTIQQSDAAGQFGFEPLPVHSDFLPACPSSGETAPPNSPAKTPIVDEEALRYQRNGDRSGPLPQFISQTHREMERLRYQLSEKQNGRKQTLSFEPTLSLLQNGENNVRARWKKQNIWQEEWGPAWPMGVPSSDTYEVIEGPLPFGIWHHEWRYEKKPGTKPTPEENSRIWDTFAEWLQEAQPIPIPVRDALAAVPFRQFLFQLFQERQWMKDEVEYKPFLGTTNISIWAYQSVKNNWIEDGIWEPTWGSMPGVRWGHEDLFGLLPNPPPDAACNNDQLIFSTFSPFFEDQWYIPGPTQFHNELYYLPSPVASNPGPASEAHSRVAVAPNPGPTSKAYNRVAGDNHSLCPPRLARAGLSRATGKRKKSGPARLPIINELSGRVQKPRKGKRTAARIAAARMQTANDLQPAIPDDQFRWYTPYPSQPMETPWQTVV